MSAAVESGAEMAATEGQMDWNRAVVRAKERIALWRDEADRLERAMERLANERPGFRRQEAIADVRASLHPGGAEKV